MLSYCRGSGTFVKPETRERPSGRQVRCAICGRWLQQPKKRPRFVPPHKPLAAPVSKT